MTATAPIRDRITELRRVKASELLANPRNWRKHPQAQSAALSAVLQEVGYADALLARETPHGLELIDGHLRQKLTPDQDVPVLVLDVTEDEANKILLTLDPLAALAESDKQALDTLLRDVTTGDAALQEMLSELASANGLTYGTQDPMPAPEPEIDRAAELQQKWGTELGQLWQIGRHRLLCGDSTQVEDVARLMDGKKAQMVFTDPPYALFGNSTGVAGIVDDKMVMPFFRELLKISRENTTPHSHIYVCCDWHSAFAIQAAARDVGLASKNLCIWDKGDGGVGAMYQQCYEMIWFFTHPPITNTLGGHESGARTVNGVPNIWRYPRATSDRVHGAEKPVAMVRTPVCHGCDEGGIVADWFIGGGTTMVVAEQTNRICYGMEIDPKYVAVTLDRLGRMDIEPRLIPPSVIV